MLHELIFALLGHTGGLIVEREEGRFEVSPSTSSFLTEAEIELITKLV